MPPDPETLRRAFAEVLVRVGLNLQSGQRLLLAEPYELLGVARSAKALVEMVRSAATLAGCPAPAGCEVIWGDHAQLRQLIAKRDWRGFARLAGDQAAIMQQYVRNGDALLFLQGSQPGMLEGIPPSHVAEMRRINWEYFGPVAQDLMDGATNWTVAPAPSPEWAEAAYGNLPAAQRLDALWSDVLESCRIAPVQVAGESQVSSRQFADAAVAAWKIHLAELRQMRDRLNARQYSALRYEADGTDLAVTLPKGHRWCTAQLRTRSGLEYVANLPTEEVFTLPAKDSATGTVRVTRPVNYGGVAITGIELEFTQGRVTAAAAQTNLPLLQQLLATDEGAGRLGEVALVPQANSLGRTQRLFYHPLLDENAANHIALGETYGFCLPGLDRTAANRSLIHVDLPLAARATLT